MTILYTAQIRGDLALLPRLHTFLQQLRRRYDARALLLDLGDSCMQGIWHCDSTGGRSALIVMDGMGYHAANVADFLAASERDKLKTSITTGLVDEQHTWRYHVPPVRDESIIVAAAPSPALTLCIVAAAAAETRLNDRTLTLDPVEKGQVGVVQVDMDAMRIATQTILEMPVGLNPDATIAASVEFVEDEARFFQNRSG